MSEMSPHSPILVVFPTPTKRQPTSSKTLQAKRMIQYARSLTLSIQKLLSFIIPLIRAHDAFVKHAHGFICRSYLHL